jgi:hypothetical protein
VHTYCGVSISTFSLSKKVATKESVPVTAKPSLRYELICHNSVRKYPDGREVCCSTPQGRAEYERRKWLMFERQKGLCCICFHEMRCLELVTFEHGAGRGMGSSHRDDRVDVPGNGAAHLFCNREKASKRHDRP